MNNELFVQFVSMNVLYTHVLYVHVHPWLFHQDRKHQIVVVAEGTSREDVAPELKKLDTVPSFLPILKSSANISHIPEADLLETLDTRAVSRPVNVSSKTMN